MKLFKILTISVGFAMVGSFASCKKYLDINETNPNLPTKVTPNVLLSNAEMSLGYFYGGDMSRYTSILTQQVRGGDRQMLSYNYYIFVASDFDQLWANVYSSTLMNLQKMEDLAKEKGAPRYLGAAKILKAFTYMTATDLFGDIPFSQALQGEKGQLKPTYDSQKSIYDALFAMLDDGINDMNNPSPGILKPGVNDDIMFGGSVAKWVAFANTVKARMYMNLTKVDNSAAGKALALVTSSPVIAADANIPYNSSSQGPWYQYNDQRADLLFDGTIPTLMANYTDPRLDSYVDTAGGFWWVSDNFAGPNAPVTLIPAAEVKFIEAEAKELTGDAAGATTAYLAAIKASCDSWGVKNADYAAYILKPEVALPGSGSGRIQRIMEQKMFALYLNPASYNDWRRTGYPAITATSGSSVPRRLLYPKGEQTSNSANVPSATLYSKVWWDN